MTQEAKPAPWRVEYHVANPNMARVIGPKFRRVPECEGGGWYTDPETARLIAAAPDLLDALKAMMDFPGGMYSPALEKRARAALARLIPSHTEIEGRDTR